MNHEKVYKRPDGTSVKVLVFVYIDGYGTTPVKYSFQVSTRQPGKRTWVDVINADDYIFRSKSIEERQAYRNEKSMELISPEELMQAKLELWEKLKPKQD